MMMKMPRALITIMLLILFPRPTAWATNHEVRIEELMAGANGDSAVQFVELAFSRPDQSTWGPQEGESFSRALLTFHDATGRQTGEFAFLHDPPVGPADASRGGHVVLIATAHFANLTGLAPDFIMPARLPAIGGMVCFTGNPANPRRFDVHQCLSYGNHAGPMEMDLCGNLNGAPAPTLPIAGPEPQSLARFRRTGPFDAFGCDHFNADFRLQRPTPTNSGRQTGTIGGVGLVEQGENLFMLEAFAGNGRTCATCHAPEDRFGIGPTMIDDLAAHAPGDPLFIAEHAPGLEELENSCLMRRGHRRALFLENVDGFGSPPVFRNSPHLMNIARTAPYGLSAAADNLRDFSQGAIAQHFPRTLSRNHDPATGPMDFRLATAFELEAMEAFMQSITFPADGNLDIDRMIAAAGAAAGMGADGLDADMARRGRDLFFGIRGEAQCFRCHNGPALADADISLGLPPGNASFDTGVAALPANRDDGCAGGPGDPDARLPAEAAGARAFNTPPLLGVAHTAPFFHDHSAPTLRNAVAFYDTPQFERSPAAVLLPEPIDLSEEDIAELTAFLEAISVDPSENPCFADSETPRAGTPCELPGAPGTPGVCDPSGRCIPRDLPGPPDPPGPPPGPPDPCAATPNCDDGDHCTVDGCESRLGCQHAELDATTPLSVTCSAANFHETLTAVCDEPAASPLDRRVVTIEQLITKAAESPKASACWQKSRKAANKARRFDRRVRKLYKAGRLGSSICADALRAEAARLRQRATAFGKDARAFCSAR